ncbi:cellulase family glycosylhydrolase [Novipirellula artificiosorum]|uniref:Uncharacterized protein n=1 Tax=Novipirellula artificiosorum TaxID=2528016 RepID=A0A5C6DHB9_9BACT|nr:cellulase family glycosylhydrolase [Novipirellula artificiosorum]TWU35992.1 hypothetical protein Poly41_37440 [Novipirellula artificiosorum]
MYSLRPGLCFVLVAILFADTKAADPISLSDANPHYFSYQGEPAFLITSGEHYGALLNLDFDFGVYFDELAKHGLNHTRVFSGVYRENAKAFGITDNPLAPSTEGFNCPWARSEIAGGVDGGNKFDLTKFNPAWSKRLKELMAAADQRGIVVELTLFCPLYNDDLWKISPMNAANNVNGIGDFPREEAYALKHPAITDVQVAFTKWVVTELRDFGNLYYEVCNEPYFGGVTMEWQNRIVDTIQATEKGFPKKHLISLNVANGRKKVENPHAGVSIFNFHYCVPPDTVSMNAALNKVIGENETGFRGQADVLYRTEAWDFLLAGGALYNNLDYSFTAKHPSGTLRDYTSPGGGSVELRQQLGILKRFLSSFDFVEMTPNPSWIKKVTPKLTTQALVQHDKAYAVYLHVPLPSKPKDLDALLQEDIKAKVVVELPEGSFRAEWVNTKTGEIDKDERFAHPGGDKTLTSPRFSNDVAVRIVRD